MLKKVFTIAMLISLTSCVNSPPRDLNQIKYQNGSAYISEQVVADIKNKVPQDVSLFVAQIPAEIVKQVQKQQVSLYGRYRKRYFAAWDDSLRMAELPLQKFYLSSFFHENNRLYPSQRRKQLIDNVKNALAINKKAIVIRDSVVKEFPTDSMFFNNLKNPGDHYPFDINIYSRIRVGAPLRALALSQDKQWCFVSCNFYSGWIHINDIAYVDDKFVKEYQALPQGICVKEKTTISNGNGFINFAEIGTILPLKGDQVLCPAKRIDGYAELVPCRASNFKKMPLKFTPTNVSTIANQFLGQEYGWGGYLGHRDCSMLTMDFFSVFGIYLPRNGNPQLKFGQSTKIKQTNKKKQILEKGIPWLTLAGKPGHVMIYAGQYEGDPVFFHNIYALKTKSNPANRIVIGETCFMRDFQCPFFDNISVLDMVTIMRNAIDLNLR